MTETNIRPGRERSDRSGPSIVANAEPGLRTPGDWPAGVADLVEHWVRRQPEAPAVHDPLTGATMTYADVWERAGWLAAELAAEGVARGDLVAVELPRSPELVVSILGIVRAAAAYLPLDLQAPPERVRDILVESGAQAVVAQPSTSRASGLGIRQLAVPSAPLPAQVPAVSAGGNDLVYVTYTSGSTGHPKGVMIPHRAVVRLVVNPNYCIIRPGDRVANTCNPAFDVTTSEIWGTLTAGATLVPFPSLTDVGLDAWLALVGTESITTMFLTTSIFHLIARERPDAFGSLHYLVVGGEQLDLAMARRVLVAAAPRHLVNGYGPTEGTSFATYFECTMQGLDGVERVPIGYALQQTSLHVLDEALRYVTPGHVGELCLGGPGLATGYLGRADLTAERFVIEPSSGVRVYRTGDLVRQLPSGALEMIGRRDRQVKLRGFRVELEEVERVTVATGLVEAAFVEKFGDGATTSLVAFVMPSPSSPYPADVLAAELSQQVGERLPDYMVPTRWIALRDLPIGSTGKADRAAMLALLQPESMTSISRAAGRRDSILGAVTAILREALDRPELSSADNFVDAGGNSLLATQVAHQLSRHYAVTVRPVDVLFAPDLAELVRRLIEAGA